MREQGHRQGRLSPRVAEADLESEVKGGGARVHALLLQVLHHLEVWRQTQRAGATRLWIGFVFFSFIFIYLHCIFLFYLMVMITVTYLICCFIIMQVVHFYYLILSSTH